MSINYSTLKTECATNPNNYVDAGSGMTLAQAFAGGFDNLCAQILNVPTNDFYIYRTDVPVNEIFDAVVWANLTPSDTPDGTQTWANRSLACQGKQFNLQTILIGTQGVLNVSKINIRAGLQDALTAIPSGTAGASRSAGWVTIRDTVITRFATRAEKLFSNKANGNGATVTTAAAPVFEGQLSGMDIQLARQAP
jgi:hypothetical protein